MHDGLMYARAAAFIAAALCMGIGMLGPSIAQGLVASKACEKIAEYPENSGRIFSAALITLAVIETCALYITGVCGAILYLSSYLS